jgi:hypothetical protein
LLAATGLHLPFFASFPGALRSGSKQVSATIPGAVFFGNFGFPQLGLIAAWAGEAFSARRAVSRDRTEYERHVRKIFGEQLELDV